MYERLSEAGIHPHRIAGVSIGRSTAPSSPAIRLILRIRIRRPSGTLRLSYLLQCMSSELAPCGEGQAVEPTVAIGGCRDADGWMAWAEGDVNDPNQS